MAKIDVTVKTTVDEANLIIEALQFYRLVRAADAHGTRLDEEGRLDCQRTVLRLEQILRGFGAAPDELPKDGDDDES